MCVGHKQLNRSRAFGGQTYAGPRNRAFDRSAHWRDVANMTERSMCGGGDAALCQITLTAIIIVLVLCFQCFDAVGWVAGRASGL